VDFSWLPKYAPLLLEGVWRTLLLLVLSGLIGNTLAVLVGFGRISRNWAISTATLGFTSVIRGTPLLVQVFLMYYGLGSVFAGWKAIHETFLWAYLREGFWYMVAALAISTAGYTGEVVRVALLSVPRGEIEAGRAFGLSPFNVIRRIWLPRALTAVLPTLAGETVLLLKATALASTITVIDLLGAANMIRAQTYRTYEPLLFVAVGYFLLTMIVERAFRLMERRYAVAYRRA
jgi:polar amino acid transport system permease protein